jgi:tetratricopeptide (TPR) repeat protein
MRLPSALGLVFLSSLPIALAIAQGNQPDQKQLEAQARQLVAEGKTLELQGKLSEAKDKYIDAMAQTPNGEALSAIVHINEQQEQQIESLIAEAHRLYDAGKFSESTAQLEHALEIQPFRPVLHYDLALGYLKLGDNRSGAASHLDSAIAVLADAKERSELLQLRSTIVMGTAPPNVPADASKPLEAFDEGYMAEDRDSGNTGRPGSSLCTQAEQLLAAFPPNPAVVFNSAKCAAEDARADDVVRQLGEYSRLAPQALDQTDAAALRETWSSLGGLPGESGQTVRRHFATASHYLDYRRYDRAIEEYRAAAQALPDFPQPQWELAVLHEAYGDTEKAAEYFARFQQLEPASARKSDAEVHRSTLETRRAVYDANVAEAQDILSNLLLRSLGIQNEGAQHKAKLTYLQKRWASQQYKETTQATEKLPQPYVVRELSKAREDLTAATDLFPLGAEANELLALIDLQGNDWPGAYRSYDAVASQGFPVSFYAQVNSEQDSKVIRAAKVEIGSDSIRLVYLSSYDPKKRVTVPPAKPAGNDDLANLVVSSSQPLDANAEALTIRPADLKGIETNQNFVVLNLPTDRIYISPLNMLTVTPFTGGAARSFGNEFTRLFIRYLGYDEAKLGKEGMTTGEKFKLGFQFARIGMAVAMMGIGAPAVYGSAVRLVQLQHALQVYRSVKEGVRITKTAGNTLNLVGELKIDAAALEVAASDQRRSIEGIPFKVIPIDPDPPKIRDRF